MDDTPRKSEERGEREREFCFVLFCFHQITKEMQRKQQNVFLIILFFLRLFIQFFYKKKERLSQHSVHVDGIHRRVEH